MKPAAIKRMILAALSGLLFGLGLAISQMTDPDKVLNFLDITDRWDPSLALVMGGALAVTVPGYAWLRRRGHTLDGGTLSLPANSAIDKRLLLGSALFGIGWGIAGYCPGPVVANLAHNAGEAVVFIAAMLAGSQLIRLLPTRP